MKKIYSSIYIHISISISIKTNNKETNKKPKAKLGVVVYSTGEVEARESELQFDRTGKEGKRE